MIQSSFNLAHSTINPPNIKIKKINNITILDKWVKYGITAITGNKIVNSTSKIKKINLTIKNWSEKDCRLFSHGENPHSKGLFFNILIGSFILIEKNNTPTTKVRITDTIMVENNIKIN